MAGRKRRGARSQGKEAAATGPEPSQPANGARSEFGRRVAALVAALGVLGAIGSYFVPKVLDSLTEAVDPRADLVVDEPTYVTDTPNFAFPTTIQPADVPEDLFLRRANHLQELQVWALGHGATAFGEQRLQIVLKGRDSAPIVVDDVSVVVGDRGPAPSSGWVNLWDGCGAALEVRHLTADVSTDAVVQRWTADGGTPTDAPVLEVTDSEVEVIEVRVFAPTAPPQTISWHITVSYSSSGERHELVVDDNDVDFELATAASARALDPYLYSDPASGLRRVVGDPTSHC